ncbi:MAG: YeeE/YedE family protein [Gammaproteobacteria bacterium]|nr:YeeE/YedE family protein [Gammaproteobacteria bacterium]
MELTALTKVILWGFSVAVILGAVVNKTNFCTMGGVSDWVNMGNTGRLSSWFLAIAIATTGVLILESSGTASVASSFPPYRTPNFAWLRYLLGGVMFGIGMTLASGCANKNLVNLGNGNLKSLFVILVTGVMAYLMTKTKFYEVVFYNWMNPLTIDLAKYDISSQSVADIFTGITGIENLDVYVGGFLATVILIFIIRNKYFMSNIKNILSGLIVGLAIVAGWYITGAELGQLALDDVSWMDVRPPAVGVQSYTFVNPMGDLLVFLASPTNLMLVTFGVASLFGVVVGSLVMSLINGSFKIVWFTSVGDFIKHFIGAILMGVGGVLAMGCTLGQGVTGVSTLALGSFIALFSIILGCATTIKVQYYKMMYEEEATFMKALLSSLVDFRLLPKGMRKLDPV